MIFRNEFHVDAPAPEVWDLLLDPTRFAACIPGVQQVVQIDDCTFDGTMLASVGPIAGQFSFRANIVDSDPPRELMAKVLGTDSVTRSTVTATMAMTLARPSAESTDLAYQMTVDIHGRLAILGDMVLRATASLMLEEFARRLNQQLADGKQG